MDYTEFERKVHKAGKARKYKVNNSWGVKDAFRLIRKNHWYNLDNPIDELLFYRIIRKINLYLAEKLSLGCTFAFPAKMGKLELRKKKTGAYLIDDKLIVTYPVNWKKTLALWYEDSEEYNKRTLIRIQCPYVFFFKYCNTEANFENKLYYQFAINRKIKRTLKNNIDKGKVDTLW